MRGGEANRSLSPCAPANLERRVATAALGTVLPPEARRESLTFNLAALAARNGRT